MSSASPFTSGAPPVSPRCAEGRGWAMGLSALPRFISRPAGEPPKLLLRVSVQSNRRRALPPSRPQQFKSRRLPHLPRHVASPVKVINQ